MSAIFHSARVPRTHNGFMLTVAIAITLFAAGSLILPKRWGERGPGGGFGAKEDLAEVFLEEGKWGVGAFALFHVIAIPFNYHLYGSPYLDVFNLVLLGMIVAAFAVFRSTTIRSATVWTMVFVTLQLASLVVTFEPAFAD